MNLPHSIEDPSEALALLSLSETRLLRQAADLRESVFGHKIDLCAIINARSGDCAMDCRFCSQSRHNQTPIKVFGLLSPKVLRARILTLAALPVRHIGIVTSGGALNADELERLCGVLASLPPELRPRVCASLGRLSAVQFAQLAEAGLTRYHHNLETSRGHYPRVCSTQTWDQRRDTVARARRAGLQVCSGGLFGLGESWVERIDLAFSLKALGVRHVPMNFLHPHPHTPLADQEILDAGEALRIIAVFRHILPQATLRICGGRPLVLQERQAEIFAAGANALMTGDYLTTDGRGVEEDLAMLAAQGLEADGYA